MISKLKYFHFNGDELVSGLSGYCNTPKGRYNFEVIRDNDTDSWFLSNKSGYSNDSFFTAFGITDKYVFLKNLGVSYNAGNFPFIKNKKDFFKVLKAIEDFYDGKQPEKSSTESLHFERHKLSLNFKL